MIFFFAFCIFLPLFALVGHGLIRQASDFIAEIEGNPPALLPLSTLLVLLFSFITSLLAVRGGTQNLAGLLIFRDTVLCSWCVVFTQLDLARRWLPLRFTNSFIISGLLYTVLPLTEIPLWVAVCDGLEMYGVLLLFRCWANRHGNEQFGLGDVYLLAGFSVWLTLPVTIVITLGALGLIMMQQLAVMAGWWVKQPEIPFAPYFCLCVSIAVLLQKMPTFTG